MMLMLLLRLRSSINSPTPPSLRPLVTRQRAGLDGDKINHLAIVKMRATGAGELPLIDP